MPPVETPATILSTIRYGETSKVARLASSGLGVISVIAKGALRHKSRFGAALQVLSEGTATVLLSRHSDLHTLIAFDAGRIHAELARDIERFAVACALGELMLRFGQQEGHPEIYEFFRHSLDLLEMAPRDSVEVIGLRMIWGLIGHLGFAPALDRCVKDGAPLDRAMPAAFAAAQGGVLCATCARGVETTRLPAQDRDDLSTLIQGTGDLPLLDERHLSAHRRLVDGYIRHHLADGAALTALAFWGDRAWANGAGR